MYPYPNEMQTFDAASKLLTLIRGGSSTRADFFHSGYVLEGFALKQMVGEPDGTIGSASAPTNPEDALELVRVLCDPNQNAASVAALPSGFWRMVWELAKKLIDELLSSSAPS